jgi:hypothetical protein
MATSTLPHLEVSQALLDEISARADEAERAGNLPVDLVAAMRDAGIFRMMQPTALGGLEVHPAELIPIVERLSHADGSTGWIGSIGAGGPAFTAWLDPAVAREVLGPNADLSIATVFAPTGQLRPGDGACTTCPVGGRSRADAGMRTGSSRSVRVRRRCAPFHREGPDWRLRSSRATRARSSTTGTCSACDGEQRHRSP